MEYGDAVYILVHQNRNDPKYLYIKYKGHIYKVFGKPYSVLITPLDDSFLDHYRAYRFDIRFRMEIQWVMYFRHVYFKNEDKIAKFEKTSGRYELLQ